MNAVSVIASKTLEARCAAARRLRQLRNRVTQRLLDAWCRKRWRAYRFWRAVRRFIDALGDAVDPIGLYCYRPDPEDWAPR